MSLLMMVRLKTQEDVAGGSLEKKTTKMTMTEECADTMAHVIYSPRVAFRENASRYLQ